MALSSGMGERRNKGFPLRLSMEERRDLKKRAGEVKLSMSEYVRCKVFDIPFKLLGGKNLVGRPRKDADTSAA